MSRYTVKIFDFAYATGRFGVGGPTQRTPHRIEGLIRLSLKGYGEMLATERTRRI